MVRSVSLATLVGTIFGFCLVIGAIAHGTGVFHREYVAHQPAPEQLADKLRPEGMGLIVRTAAEGASEEELRRDVERLTAQWSEIEEKVAEFIKNQASRSAAAFSLATYCSSTLRPSGVSAASSCAPAAVPYRVSIFSRTESKVGTPSGV